MNALHPVVSDSPATHAPASHSGWAGFWRLADPKISLASMASIFLGTCAAAAAGPLDYRWLALTVAGIFAIEVAKNASGEIFDYDSGADQGVLPEDRSPFSGGKRVLVDGLLTRAETAWISAIGYLAGISAGLWIGIERRSAILAIGIIGVACAYFYHANPLKLSYRGWGEAAVGVCYGPLIAAGTYLVQRPAVEINLLLASLPLGLLIAAFLWINEFPDFASDKAAGKRTWVVRLGRPRASRAFATVVGAAFAIVLVLPLAGVPITVWLGLIGAWPAVAAARQLWKNPDVTQRMVPAQGKTLLSFLLYATGAGVGLLWA